MFGIDELGSICEKDDICVIGCTEGIIGICEPGTIDGIDVCMGNINGIGGIVNIDVVLLIDGILGERVGGNDCGGFSDLIISWIDSITRLCVI
jgi:hypothetical protein